MRTVLMLAMGICLCFPASAAPPSIGSQANIVDDVFGNNVICDTVDQVKSIVTADDPMAEFTTLSGTPNAIGEPTCAAVYVDHGTITSIESLGVVSVHGHSFNGWVLGLSNVGKQDLAVLYLELIGPKPTGLQI